MAVAPDPLVRLHVLGTLELLGMHGEELRSVLVQPKRLALFAYLVLAKPAGFHHRDSLLALFWPEADTERARLALRQALHHLRKALGASVIVARGDEEIGIAVDKLWCDASAFERLLANQSYVEALALYRGDLLAGFFPSDVAPEFQQWVEHERTRLREHAAAAAWKLSAAAEEQQNGIEAAHWGRKAVHFAPDDEAGFRRLITLLDNWGDRAGALREYDDFSSRLQDEFDIEPSPETLDMMAAVRARQQTNGSTKVLPEQDVLDAEPAHLSSSSTVAESVPGAESGKLTKLRRSRGLVVGAIMLAAVLIVGVLAIALRTTQPSVPLLAVGQITNEAGADSEEAARLLSGLLATDLSRVSGLPVLSQSRLLEALGQNSAAETAQALSNAARRAGATELIEGVLYRRGNIFRLDLTRIDLARGVVRQSYSASGSDAFELLERATAEIARAFELAAPATPLGQSASGSLVARRFYEQGLRAFYRGEARNAYQLFSAALAEDSTFAMAAFYAAKSVGRLDSAYVMLVKAAQLAERAPEHDRLVINVARYTNDYASRLAAAESLAVRYPTDPDGHLALANVRSIAGDFGGAIPHARRVIAMDSLELGGKRAVCTACDAFDVLIWTYRSMGIDSFPAVERTAREWIKRQPEAALAWRMLAEALAWRGQRAAALDAFNKVMQVDPTRTAAVIFWRAVVEGEKYAEAERVLRDRLRFNEIDGLDWLIHVLRHQGRPSQALELAREGKRFAARVRNSDAVALGTSAEAQILFELGRFREAAKLFQAAHTIRTDSGSDAYSISWVGQHTATAWAAAGDTVRVAQLAASIERVAHRASHGLAWHAAPYVRGLLWQARGQPARAAAEFRAAIYSPTFGYTRANFELARTYLSLGKAQEAIRILREVLGGTSTGVGFYVTRTEIHELMARAFEAAHQRDSAAVHYRAVIAAWNNGDPPYRARANLAQRKLSALVR